MPLALRNGLRSEPAGDGGRPHETCVSQVRDRSGGDAHRKFPFRGVIFDVDPVFANTEEWWLSIPADVRPRKDQPFYHLLAENAETEYIAYVSEQNLLPDTSGDPLRHPQVDEMFVRARDGTYTTRTGRVN
jgi:heat shock protein HspQ